MNELLLAATPPSWFEAAATRLDELLLDHANCEKKAASTALAMIFAYPEDSATCAAFARLAREELRHFEQVDRLRREQGIAFRRLQPSRYADSMRRLLRSEEPGRRLDLMVLGAFIEARSYERFKGLLAVLPTPVAALYRQLMESEARHRNLYWRLAADCAGSDGAAELTRRAREFGALEAELVTTPDAQFRFHSGAPA